MSRKGWKFESSRAHQKPRPEKSGRGFFLPVANGHKIALIPAHFMRRLSYQPFLRYGTDGYRKKSGFGLLGNGDDHMNRMRNISIILVLAIGVLVVPGRVVADRFGELIFLTENYAPFNFSKNGKI